MSWPVDRGHTGALLEDALDERESTPPGAAPLDLHEGISAPSGSGCPRWPEHLRLRASNGELVRGRCRATNQCAYCATLAAVETSEVLALDAMEGPSPALWGVLTTPHVSIDPRRFYRAREALQRTLKRVWPDAEAATLLEFTTGYGPRSSGRRRPHWNLLWKGIHPDDQEHVLAVVEAAWCPRVDGSRSAQHVGAIAEANGLMRYLALHFQKQSQAPPRGWRGHRFMASRGYFSTPLPELRERARDQLRFRRELRAVRRALPEGIHFDALEVDEWAQASHDRKRALSWDLVRVQPTSAPPPKPRRVVARG